MLVKLSDDYVKRPKALAVAGSYWHGGGPDTDLDSGWYTEVQSSRAAAHALALFPEILTRYPELGAMRDIGYGEARPKDFASACGIKLTWKFDGIEPYEFQRTDTGYLTAQARRMGGGFLGWDRGLGKTLATLAMCDALGAERVLVVCGNTMKDTVWRKEIRNVHPDACVVVLPNAKAKREAAIKQVAKLKKVIFVVHYEALALIAGNKGRGEGWNKLGKWDVMAFDESHRLARMVPGSRSNTNMGRATMKARSHATVAFALTGTAIMNKGDDLFGQLHYLFPKTYKQKHRDFCDRFLEYIDTDYGKVCVGFKPGRLQDLRDELGVFMVYRTKDDELDLPERIIEDRLVELSASQRRAYDELITQWWTQLDSGETIKATNAISMLTKLRQVATGLSLDGDVADSTKIEWALADILDNPDEAFVVLSWYKAPLAALSARLSDAGVGHFHIDGDVKQSDRVGLVEKFQGGEGRVFLGTISTLGESVNLQRANHMITLDRSWNPAQNAQAMDRIYRIGQDKRVVVTNLIAKDTVDELRVQPVLASKDAIRKSVFGAAR